MPIYFVRVFLVSLLAVVLSTTICQAIEQPTSSAPEQTKTSSQARILAKVDAIPVYSFEVERTLATLQKQGIKKSLQSKRVRKAVLEQLVQQKLAYRWLQRNKQTATKYNIAQELAKQRAKYESQGKSLDATLKANGIPMEAYTQSIAWKLSWKAYLKKKQTQQTLKDYFKTEHRHFDGSQVQARHLLIKFPSAPLPSGPSQLESEKAQDRLQKKLHERAEIILEQIEQKQLTFEEAVEKFSEAPSKTEQGNLGYFPRRGVLHENLSKAAFALKTGEVSKPVTTPFGIHLIKKIGERPGKLAFEDVAEEVRAAATKALFRKLASEQRKLSKVVVLE